MSDDSDHNKFTEVNMSEILVKENMKLSIDPKVIETHKRKQH